MLNISRIQQNNVTPQIRREIKNSALQTPPNTGVSVSLPSVSGDILRAYNPAFRAVSNNLNINPAPGALNIETPIISKQEKLSVITSKLDTETKELLTKLDAEGKLDDNSSNDGSTVTDNLYKMATEPRIPGLKDSQLIKEVLTAIDNPASVTQKFGDIPDNVASEISSETGTPFPEAAKDVVSSCCVVASMEYNLASKTPAEFARFAAGLSGYDYSVDKNIKMDAISEGTAGGIWMLREFNTDNKIGPGWDNVNIKIKPDRNAIVRARVQASYRDPGERSCTDVLIQSALLNLGAQNTYDALTDERTGKFNPEKTGLTDFEKNFVEEVVFGKPKISVVYQQIDENGYLTGYNCQQEETKQHILKTLNSGQNVIVGYTHLDETNLVEGGHEITITDIQTDENGVEYFICNDTDDNIDGLIKIEVGKLLPLIHHAGISKEALSSEDVIVEPWREVLEDIKSSINANGVQ